MKLGRFSLHLLLSLLLTALTGCEPSETDQTGYAKTGVVRIGSADGNGRLTGLFGLAKRLGYLDEALTPLNYRYTISGFAGAGPAVNEALVAGSVDIAVYADFPALIAASKGVDIAVIMTEDALINAVVAVRQESNLLSLKDLIGKRVSLPRGTYMQRYFTQLVQDNGYTLNDFTLVQMTGDAEAALINGAIDAMVWTEQSTARLQHKAPNVKTLYSTRTEPKLAGISVVVSQKKFAQKNPAVTEAIYQALRRAADFAKSNPNKAMALLALESNMPIEVIETIHDFANPQAYRERYGVDTSDNDRQRLRDTQAFMIDEGLITRRIDIDEFAPPH